MINESKFGPFSNLPLNLELTFPIRVDPNGILTLDIEMVEGERYWIILYTETKEEFLQVLVGEKGQSIQYISVSGINLLFTHWNETKGMIKQCTLITKE